MAAESALLEVGVVFAAIAAVSVLAGRFPMSETVLEPSDLLAVVGTWEQAELAAVVEGGAQPLH